MILLKLSHDNQFEWELCKFSMLKKRNQKERKSEEISAPKVMQKMIFCCFHFVRGASDTAIIKVLSAAGILWRWENCLRVKINFISAVPTARGSKCLLAEIISCRFFFLISAVEWHKFFFFAMNIHKNSNDCYSLQYLLRFFTHHSHTPQKWKNCNWYIGGLLNLLKRLD